MSRPVTSRRIVLLSLLNVGVMLLITYAWLASPRTFGEESFLIKWSALTKKSLFGFDAKPSPDEVLFIDVSGSRTVIPDPEALSFLPEAGYHRRVITSREDLAQLFAIIGRYREEVKLVVCDVLLDAATPHDSLLREHILTLGDRVLTVSHLDEGRQLVRPVIDVPSALATYRATDNLFLKFPLIFNDSLKTIPLRMFELTTGHHLGHWGPFYTLGNHLTLPAPIVDFKVRPADFRATGSLETSTYSIYPLGTILESELIMDPEQLGSYFRNRTVMIGDFAGDQHETPFGEMSGLLLLYNAYLSLVAGHNVVRLPWILFLLLCFFVVSYRLLADIQFRKPRFLRGFFRSVPGRLFLESIDEMIFLILISLFSYFIFGIQINILILFVYLKLVEWGWTSYRRKSVASAPTSSLP